MIFNSLEFGLFFAVVLGSYWCLGRRSQNALLLVASYVFYSAWDWRFLSLILISTVVDYVVGRSLQSAAGPRRRRWLVGFSLATNLGILGVFKYADFFVEGLTDLLRLLGFGVDPFVLGIVLPVGISFYTFQTLSYTIDIYRNELQPTKNFLDFALFVAFFPQLVAGPIERATRLLPQIQRRRSFDPGTFGEGGWLVLWGLFKKVVIADNLAHVVDRVYYPGAEATAPQVVLATYAFAVQIYCDFSGYSSIARGVAKMLGIELMVNFARPYFARGPSEFWRRWHISLSTWLRDYLYIPLGGNRKGSTTTYRNLMLTMLLGGLWHGAAWTFLIWGGIHGIWLATDRWIRSRRRTTPPPDRLARSLAHGLLTFHLVCLAWIFFRAENLSSAFDLLGTLFGPWQLTSVAGWALPFAVLVAPLLLVEAVREWRGDRAAPASWPWPLRTGTYVLLVFAIVLLGEDFGQPFIYFQF